MLGGLLCFFFLGALVDSVSSLRFNFTDVSQCSQATISFAGNNTKDVPDSLAIVPFNSSPVYVPIPNPALVSSGIALTFLPFTEGTNFLLSLDDAMADNIINVSDVIRILPSAQNDTSCLPTPSPPGQTPPRRFEVQSPATQCEPLTIKYDVDVIKEAPIVRLLSPKGPSFYLEQLSDDATNGTATYMMNFRRGGEIVLVIDDGGGIRETSSLLTVQGDSLSSEICLAQKKTEKNTSKDKDKTDSESDSGAPSASRAVIIGSASGGAAVLLIGACMGVFIWRDRRRRRQRRFGGDVFASLEKATQGRPTSPPMRPRRPSRGLSTLNPLYTTGFLSPTRSSAGTERDSATDSLASWVRVDGDRKTGSPLSPSRFMPRRPPRSVDNASIQSLDIEGILNLATMQSETNNNINNFQSYSNRKPPSVMFGAIVSAEPTIAMPEPAAVGISVKPERHLRNPADVPADYNSKTFSNYSLTNPFEGSRVSVVELDSSDEATKTRMTTTTGRRGSDGGGTLSYPTDRGSVTPWVIDGSAMSLARRDSAGSQSSTGSRRAVGLPSSPRAGGTGAALDRRPPSGSSNRTWSSAWYGIAS